MELNESVLRRLGERLVALYGAEDWESGEFLLLPADEEPLDTLVRTVLSQATSDVNSRRAFRRLKQSFPTWQQVLDAPLNQLVEAIRPGGLAEQKAPRIKNLLKEIRRLTGSFSLKFLRDWDRERAYRFLLDLEGVGPKTAACVLTFSCDKPVFPVDTHIARVCRRLGLVPAGWPAEKIQTRLQDLVPPELVLALHLNLIRHGRRTCRARKPACDTCFLKQECRYAAAPPADSGAKKQTC